VLSHLGFSCSVRFHLFPTDGYVNSIRSNYPYGPVKRDRSVKYTSTNGAVLGVCAPEAHMPRASGQTCFEPADDWKGELARGSLYMSIAYADAGFKCCDNFAVTRGLPNESYLRTLLAWHVAHPPTATERARNEVIYARYQQNRNPFIDYPEWAAQAWPELVPAANQK
jgi:endonuclease I